MTHAYWSALLSCSPTSNSLTGISLGTDAQRPKSLQAPFGAVSEAGSGA
jgi:hypothetical protein